MNWIHQQIFFMVMFAVLSSNQRLTTFYSGGVKYLATRKINNHRNLEKAAANQRIYNKTTVNYPTDFEIIRKPKDYFQKSDKATTHRVKRGATEFKITNLGPNIYPEIQAQAKPDQHTLWLLNLLKRMDKIDEQKEQLMGLGSQSPNVHRKPNKQKQRRTYYYESIYNLDLPSGGNLTDFYQYHIVGRVFNSNWNGTTFYWSNYPRSKTPRPRRPRNRW